MSFGAHLLWDTFHRDETGLDCALVLSNDADLQTPVETAMKLGIKVVVVNPHRHHGQKDHLFGSDRRNLRVSHLQRSQLPREVHDSLGRLVFRPTGWDR